MRFFNKKISFAKILFAIPLLLFLCPFLFIVLIVLHGIGDGIGIRLFCHQKIVGDYYLFDLREGGAYCNKVHYGRWDDSGGGVFDGVVEQIGWNDEWIVAEVQRLSGIDTSGWYVLNVKTGKIFAPILKENVLTNDCWKTIKCIPSQEVWKNHISSIKMNRRRDLKRLELACNTAKEKKEPLEYHRCLDALAKLKSFDSQKDKTPIWTSATIDRKEGNYSLTACWLASVFFADEVELNCNEQSVHIWFDNEFIKHCRDKEPYTIYYNFKQAWKTGDPTALLVAEMENSDKWNCKIRLLRKKVPQTDWFPVAFKNRDSDDYEIEAKKLKECHP